MNDDRDKVEGILEDLDLGEDTSETPSDLGGDGEPLSNEETESGDRLSRLHEAGAITNEEFEVLQSHIEKKRSTEEEVASDPTPDSVEFGNPIVTSEGTEVDFSIIGVFNDIENSRLLLPDYLDSLDESDLPPTHQGGPERTIVFLLIHNHSDREIKFRHSDFEFIGTDQIAYNQSKCPVNEDKLGPGLRAGNKVYISPDTRIKYACGAEMPVDIDEVRISGKCADVHTISVTDEMRFPKSELPTTVEL